MGTNYCLYKQFRRLGLRPHVAMVAAAAMAEYHATKLQDWEDSRDTGYPPQDSWVWLPDAGMSVCGPHCHSYGDVDYVTVYMDDGTPYAIA